MHGWLDLRLAIKECKLFVLYLCYLGVLFHNDKLSAFLMTLVYLCTFNFSGPATLGGQKSRVAFAKITFKKPHIILLDEPSNHLVSRHPFFACLLSFGNIQYDLENPDYKI